MMNIGRMRWAKYTMGTCNGMWDVDCTCRYRRNVVPVGELISLVDQFDSEYMMTCTLPMPKSIQIDVSI